MYIISGFLWDHVLILSPLLLNISVALLQNNIFRLLYLISSSRSQFILLLRQPALQKFAMHFVALQKRVYIEYDSFFRRTFKANF